MKQSDLNLENILSDERKEEDWLEIPLADRVFKIFSLVFFILAGVMLVQFLNLSIWQHDFYAQRAFANASDIQIKPAPRGIIFDRFGKALLSNESAYNVFLAPTELPKSLEERTRIFDRISVLLEINTGVLSDKILKKDWNLSDRLFLTDSITHDQLVSLSVETIPGLKIEPTFERVHESTFKFSHVLGYSSLVGAEDLQNNSELTIDDLVGRAGLEAYYDNYLRGTNGREVFLRDSRGQIMDKQATESPKPGANLETYIDGDFQEYFYDRLQEALNNLGRSVGVGIAINPQNGEVLALFNIPGFDSTNISVFLNQTDQPLFNRAVSGLYSPGSTIKPLVATAALIEGVIDPLKQIFSAGYIEVPNPYNQDLPSRFLDWKPQGWVDLYSALARSSNVYFYEIGGGFTGEEGLGIDRLKEWWHKFSLDEKTNIDLIGEKSGFLPDPVWKEEKTKIPWRLGDTYNVTIGQGDLLVTPLGLLHYVSAIANGEKFYEPRIMKVITNEKGEVIKESKPKINKDLSLEIGQVLPDVRQGMRDAVAKLYGTANLLSSLPVEVAAKTGSAQIENNAKTNAFFVGYAPYDNPQIAIIILVENAREGSLNVVPVAKDVFMWYYENRIKNQH